MNEHIRPIDDVDELPTDVGDEEMIDFLDERGVSEAFLESTPEVPEEERPIPRTKPINIRFDDFTLRRLKEMADRKNVGYQTLLKMFVTERLYEEEKREGALAAGQVADSQAPQRTDERQDEPKKRDWQQRAYDYVKENESIIEDEDLDFVVSSRLLKDATSLLLEISNEIKAANAKDKFPAVRLDRMVKGYNRLKEFCDRAFAVHEERFGLPELEEDGGKREVEASSGEDEESAVGDDFPEETVSKEHGATVTPIQEAMRKRQRALDIGTANE